MASPSITKIPPQLPSQEADAEKSAAEVRRINAERRKIVLEALEIRKRVNARWYQGRFFLQATVGAIVASALLAAWLITYMQPILNRKQEIALQWTLGLRQANKTLVAVRSKVLDGQYASIACCPPVGEEEAGSGGDQPAKE